MRTFVFSLGLLLASAGFAATTNTRTEAVQQACFLPASLFWPQVDVIAGLLSAVLPINAAYVVAYTIVSNFYEAQARACAALSGGN